MKRRIAENLDLDTDKVEWCCHQCGHSLGAAHKNYKEACLISNVSPHEIWRPFVEGKFNFSFDPEWCRLVEFYCPGCATLLDVEMLPPGHPLTHDIELDIDAVLRKTKKEMGDRA